MNAFLVARTPRRRGATSPQLNSPDEEITGKGGESGQKPRGSDRRLRGEGVDQDFQARGPMLTASWPVAKAILLPSEDR